MDIKGLRQLNHIGTFFVGVIGFLVAGSRLFFYSLPSGDSTCMTLSLIWVCIILILTILLYYHTVLGLDRGDYDRAKEWTFIGIIVGFVCGIIPFLIFIISYVSFDDAIRTQRLGQTKYNNQQLEHINVCENCGRRIPFDSYLCRYCGFRQYPKSAPDKPLPPSPKRIDKKKN